MTAATSQALLKSSVEGDFPLPVEFPLEAGGVLRGARLYYALYGEVNAARDNVVFVCHALSGSAQVAEWWPAIFSSEGLIDPQRDAVLGINILGSCYGSTGPASIDPATGRRYGSGFPLVGIRDIVRSQALLLDSLGISRLKLAIGASIGGMQALEWAILFPSRIARVIAIAAAPLGAMGLGLNHLQRQAIMLDPDWKNGEYSVNSPPRRGLALARSLAVCTYKSATLFEERYRRKPDRSGEDPWQDDGPVAGRFDVSGYLDHQGDKFNARFDANSYLVITRMMDLFDPTRGYAQPVDAWERIEAAVTLVGISSDWLFPAADVAGMAAVMKDAGVRCDYRELISDHGHDSFLAEPQLLIDLLTK
jgi:homoserine O-acetyltransferase/O-succinyltransferase